MRGKGSPVRVLGKRIATRSSAPINGLVPGKRYAFRIRALGAFCLLRSKRA